MLSPNYSILLKLMTFSRLPDKLARKVIFCILLVPIFFLNAPIDFQSSYARADGGGGGDTAEEYAKYFREKSAKQNKTKQSTKKRGTRSKSSKKQLANDQPKQDRSQAPKLASTAPAAKKPEETAASLKKRLDEAHAYWTKDDRTIHQQVDDQKDLIYNLSLALDAVDTLTDELMVILKEQRELDEVVRNWSTNPYGEGRLTTKAKTKATMTTAGLIFTGKINPVGVILGLIADGIEGTGRLWYKHVARLAVLKEATSISQALQNAIAQYKKIQIALEAAKDDLKRLLITSNSVFELSLDHQAAVQRERRAAQPATKSALLTREHDEEGDLEEFRKLKAEQRRRSLVHGVSKCP